MILLDAIYINNSGGKVLLDYLIETLEKSNLEIHYLLDERVRNKHPFLKNSVTYLDPSFFKRHQFYRKNKNTFSKVLCFGNLPPTIKLKAIVYTYFHQNLFLEIPRGTPIHSKVVFVIKSFILKTIQNNTDFWIVQTELMANSLQKKMTKPVLIIPFYPQLLSHKDFVRKSNTFLYVSSGAAHKNHNTLFTGFKWFYDEYKVGELHVTVGAEFKELYAQIQLLVVYGYPIINHGFIPRSRLNQIYATCTFAIYPSLSESFGLGIIEALENKCDIIGANLPYIFAVCEPSLVFDPTNCESIKNCFKIACQTNIKPSKQLVFNEIDSLISFLN